MRPGSDTRMSAGAKNKQTKTNTLIIHGTCSLQLAKDMVIMVKMVRWYVLKTKGTIDGHLIWGKIFFFFFF